MVRANFGKPWKWSSSRYNPYFLLITSQKIFTFTRKYVNALKKAQSGSEILVKIKKSHHKSVVCSCSYFFNCFSSRKYELKFWKAFWFFFHYGLVLSSLLIKFMFYSLLIIPPKKVLPFLCDSWYCPCPGTLLGNTPCPTTLEHTCRQSQLLLECHQEAIRKNVHLLSLMLLSCTICTGAWNKSWFSYI